MLCHRLAMTRGSHKTRVWTQRPALGQDWEIPYPLISGVRGNLLSLSFCPSLGLLLLLLRAALGVGASRRKYHSTASSTNNGRAEDVVMLAEVVAVVAWS